MARQSDAHLSPVANPCADEVDIHFAGRSQSAAAPASARRLASSAWRCPLERLQKLRLANFHAAISGFPKCERSLSKFALSKHQPLRSSFLFLQHRNDLLFRKSLLLHCPYFSRPDSNKIWRKVPTGPSLQFTSTNTKSSLRWRRSLAAGP